MTKDELIRLATEAATNAPYRSGVGIVVIACELATGDIGWATTMTDAGTTAALRSVTHARSHARNETTYPLFHSATVQACVGCGMHQADATEQWRAAGLRWPDSVWPCACRTGSVPAHMVS